MSTTTISLEAFETEKDLRDWVTAQWNAGRMLSHAVVSGHMDPPTGESIPFTAGYEAHQQMSEGAEVAAGFTLGSQIRQHEEEYRRLQAQRLIDDSAKASMSPLLHEHRSEELDEAMGIIGKFGSYSDDGDFLPFLVRPIDEDARPLAIAKDISIDAARELVAKRYIEMAADRSLTNRIDMRFDLGMDLLAPQIVFTKVPKSTNAWLARGEKVWAFWYLPEIWVTRDGTQRSSWYHAGDWVDPVNDEDRARFVPGVWGCVAVFTDETKAARAQAELLKAVLTVRRISAELAAADEYEADPVRQVGTDEDQSAKPTFRGKPQIFTV